MKCISVSSILLLVSLFFYTGSVIPSIYGIKSPAAEYRLIRYNETDKNNFYNLCLNNDNISIVKTSNQIKQHDRHNHHYQIYTIESCSFESIRTNKSCGEIKEIGNLDDIEITINNTYLIYHLTVITPIAILITQIIISIINYFKSNRVSMWLFKYFRFLLFIVNVISISLFVVINYGYSNLLGSFNNENLWYQGITVAFTSSMFNLILTSIAAYFLLLSIVEFNNNSNNIGMKNYKNKYTPAFI